MKRLSRRQFLVSTAAAAALVGLPGCGGTSGLQDDVVTSGGRLAILNWSEYLDPELLEGVQLQLGLDIDYQELWEDNYGGQDLFGPQWDIVTPTNWLAAQYVRDGSVQRLPVEFIPNHKNIDPVFLTNGWDRGARFHMPWQSGITGIAYDPALTGRELTSVSDLFAPDLKGRVAMIGEMREAVGLAMLANGDDPARPTVAQAETAYLQLEAANDQGQFHSWVFNEFTDLLKGGQVAASMAWSGDAVQLQLDRPDIKFVIPDEGAIQWFDTMVIPTGANNAKGAAEWMNTFYDPVLAAANTQWVQYISPVLGVEDELRSLGGPAAELANNPVLFPDDETRRRLFIWGGLDSTGDEQDLDDRFAGFLPAT
jgi:spermidine/putrescine transport system substrate-binding protein